MTNYDREARASDPLAALSSLTVGALHDAAKAELARLDAIAASVEQSRAAVLRRLDELERDLVGHYRDCDDCAARLEDWERRAGRSYRTEGED